MIVSTHDGVKVGFHELLVEIHLIKVPIWAKDYVHVIQASDLYPTTRVRPEGEKKENENYGRKDKERKKNVRSCVCGNDAATLMIRPRRTCHAGDQQAHFVQYTSVGEGGEKARRAGGTREGENLKKKTLPPRKGKMIR
jgi:hypothetical protein